MCSISGAFVIERGGIINPHHLKEIISNAQERGRDSSGLYLDGKLYTSFKKDTIPSFPLGKDYHVVAINNNRAEPTTEYVKEKNHSNYCDFFRFKDDTQKKTGKEEAKKLWDELFTKK